MTRSLRWSLVALIAVVGVVVALVSTMGHGGAGSGTGAEAGGSAAGGGQAPPVGQPDPSEPITVADAAARTDARLPSCRDRSAPATTSGPLAGFMVRCMDDGSTTTLGKIQAGKPMLVNLWAYWCAPCRKELPALRAAQEKLGDRVRIVLSHTDPSETKGLATLTDLDMHLVSVSDAEEQLPPTLGAPPVLPVSVFVRPDGSIARAVPSPMDDERAVLDAVAKHLGVRA